MDFGTLLHMARKNSENDKNSESRFYSTKYSAPKKETKEKKLSDNIKRFLAKKEQEEKEKAKSEKEKLAKLLAMRDEKSKNKIRKMLKVTKSANKSVLADAIDNENTAITLQGPDQPDEDDYGYVSQEAAAFYQKYMDKVKAIPDDNKFAPSRSSTKADLCGTKDRVREAIRKEQEEKNNPHRTKSSSLTSKSETYSKASSSLSDASLSLSRKRKDLYDPEAERERDQDEQKRREDERKKAKLKKSAPPPMDFKELLRLAEKKQYEPVEVEVEVEKEPERLLTKKQKKELEDRKAYLEERERKERSGINSNSNNASGGKVSAMTNGRIPKVNGASSNDSRKFSIANDKISSKSNSSSQSQKASVNMGTLSSSKDVFKKPTTPGNSNGSVISKPKMSSSDLKSNHRLEVEKVKSHSSGTSNLSNSDNSKNISKLSNGQTPSKSLSLSIKSNHANTKPTTSALTNSQKSTISKPSLLVSNSSVQQQRQIAQKSSISGQKSASSISQNPKEVIKSRPFPPPHPSDRERTRQFPPSDVRSSKPMMKKPMKRRIIDDEDEYDSELDDFIDDGPEDGSDNYSSYIKEIFGYDKSRYRDVDDDDPNMESSFVQQMKEETLSKKIGLMEDLEDMRIEAEEKRKKALTKKKKLK